VREQREREAAQQPQPDAHASVFPTVQGTQTALAQTQTALAQIQTQVAQLTTRFQELLRRASRLEANGRQLARASTAGLPSALQSGGGPFP